MPWPPLLDWWRNLGKILHTLPLKLPFLLGFPFFFLGARNSITAWTLRIWGSIVQLDLDAAPKLQDLKKVGETSFFLFCQWSNFFESLDGFWLMKLVIFIAGVTHGMIKKKPKATRITNKIKQKEKYNSNKKHPKSLVATLCLLFKAQFIFLLIHSNHPWHVEALGLGRSSTRWRIPAILGHLGWTHGVGNDTYI